ncbi:HPr kinase [Virgisporangium aliadipatigenens]|uniref:HPr kinase n=1 Tax=Virgisporangium aliadipatigenens TaxID=741659 RepID=A0A8J4DRY1_9ACTN|nr:hypothetical protein [Virgisporangium aliadipatigenens]GIJ46752.1 HPr kinase [Virgisporangium aliadipatigenens]
MTVAARHEVLDASVERGAVPDDVPAPAVDAPWLRATAREALVRIPDVGAFHVRDGRRVVVDPVEGVPQAVLDTVLHGTVTALVLAQRGTFALHASTVRVGDGLVATAGPRGVGKSTTVGLLAERGHPIVTDDVTAVEPGAGAAVVRPTGKRLRLWPETARRLGYDPSDGELSWPGEQKYAFAVTEPAGGSHRLDLVVALRAVPGLDRPRVHRLDGAAAAHVLAVETYRPFLRALHPEAYLRWLAALARTVPVLRLERPAEGWSGEEVAAAIERAAA